MAITDATEFSTFDNDGDTNGGGVTTADTFNEWRRKTNGIINQLSEVVAAGSGGFNRKIILTNYMDNNYAFPEDDTTEASADDSTILRTSWSSPYSGLARITCIAGGGGGGTGANNVTSGTGGGGGEVAVSFITLVEDRVYDISIGQGGNVVTFAFGAQQDSGGNTSWQGNAIVANGGTGGFHGGNPIYSGGTGGSGGTGDYLISGTNGGSLSNGDASSYGGDSYGSGGKAGTTAEGAYSPLAGQWGGGGGGAHSSGSGSYGTGCKGAPGAIIIEF